MHKATGLSAIIVFSSLASAAPNASPQPPSKTPAPPPAPKEATLSERMEMLTPIQVESLTLTPIVAKATPEKPEQLIVLDEAMKKKLVRIHEVKDEDVNNLTLTNKSDQPLFLLAGEVIIGGKQDRIIGKNTIVPAKKTLTVPVFCVEHGRWDNSGKEFTTANALAHGRLRGSANFDTQSDVWKEVAAKNELRNTKSSTDTYRNVAKQQASGTVSTWEKQVDTGLGKLTDNQKAKLVGFAVSLNGKVATVDVFEDPALFKKLQKKLVRSYITEAVDVKTDKTAKAPTAKDVDEFIADAEAAQEERTFETDLAESHVKKGGKAAKAKVMYKPARRPDAAPTVAAPPAKSVYESYQVR
jgi:hypothetical protein